MSQAPIPNDQGKAHRDQLLAHEVDASEDPVCSCEPEPRWLLFQDEIAGAPASEWDSLERPPSAEL